MWYSRETTNIMSNTEQTQRTKGMREQILTASSVAEVQSLCGEVQNNFNYASAKTIRRCERAADRRIRQLQIEESNGKR